MTLAKVMRAAVEWRTAAEIAEATGLSRHYVASCLHRVFKESPGRLEKRSLGQRVEWRAAAQPEKQTSLRILEECDYATSREIADVVGCKQSYVTNVLAYMRHKGWVDREIIPSLSGFNKAVWRLTDSGKQRLETRGACFVGSRVQSGVRQAA